MNLIRSRGQAPSWLPLVVAVACGLLFIVELMPFARLGVDEHHDGLILKNALDVYHGVIPYRDSYNQYGFLPSVLAAGLMHVLGPTLLTLKLAAVIAYAVAVGTMVLAWRRAMPLAAAVSVGAIWMLSQPEVGLDLFLLPWPSVYALAFIGGATVAHLRSFESESHSVAWAVLSGVLAVAAVYSRLPVGILLVVGLVVSYATRWGLYRERAGRAATAFVAAAAIAAALVLVVMLALGALRPMIDQTVIQPQAYFNRFGPREFFFAVLPPALTWVVAVGALCFALRWALSTLETRFGGHTARIVGVAIAVVAPVVAVAITQAGWITIPQTDWWPAEIVVWYPPWVSWETIWVASGLVTVVFAGLAVAAAILSVFLGQRPLRTWAPPAMISLAIVGAAGIAQFYPVFEQRHAYWACVPALGVLVWLLLRVAGRQPLAAVAVLLVICAVPAANSFKGARHKLQGPHGSIPHFRVFDGIVQHPTAEARLPLLTALKQAFTDRPNAAVLNVSNDGLWGSLGQNMANPDAYFVIWPCPANQRRRGEFIARFRPIIWWEGGTLSQVQTYAKNIGYRVVASATARSSWKSPTFLLLPGEATPAPPYVWRDASLPAPPWATGPAAPATSQKGCPS